MKTNTLRRSAAGPALSDRGYAFSVGLFTTLGIAVTGLAAFFSTALTLTLPTFLILLAISLSGIFVATRKNTTFALIGYAMVAIPLGMLLGPLVAVMKMPQILMAVGLTGGLTTVLWIVATIIPKISDGVGLYVIAALFLLLVGAFIFTSGVAFTLYTILGIIVFSVILVVDVNRALNDADKSLASAIFNAVGIYLDVLNILIRILSLSGSSSSRS